jgi:hypothetical protein
MSNVTLVRLPSIRCAHCKMTHTSVERVRECAEVEQIARETCEHGLAAWLCVGPTHYPTMEDEMLAEIQEGGWI